MVEEMKMNRYSSGNLREWGEIFFFITFHIFSYIVVRDCSSGDNPQRILDLSLPDLNAVDKQDAVARLLISLKYLKNVVFPFIVTLSWSFD